MIRVPHGTVTVQYSTVQLAKKSLKIQKYRDRYTVMACHVKTPIWLHKLSVKVLHITQSVTQSKIAKNCLNYTKIHKFQGSFLTFFCRKYRFSKRFWKTLICWKISNLKTHEKLSHDRPNFEEFSSFWAELSVFMGQDEGQNFVTAKIKITLKWPEPHLFYVTITKKSQRSTQYYTLHITRVHYTPPLNNGQERFSVWILQD